MKTKCLKQHQYNAALKRIDELLLVVNNETPATHPNFVELEAISDNVEAYENIHYHIAEPAPQDILKLSAHEMGLTQKGWLELLNTIVAVPHKRKSLLKPRKMHVNYDVAMEVA
jgi:HTH-type transcriptional regulator/antitoxin HigA